LVVVILPLVFVLVLVDVAAGFVTADVVAADVVGADVVTIVTMIIINVVNTTRSGFSTTRRRFRRSGVIFLDREMSTSIDGLQDPPPFASYTMGIRGKRRPMRLGRDL